MAEAAPGNHRHEGAAGGEHRREHQADIVADAAGRMLVDDRARQVQAASSRARRPSASSRASDARARRCPCRERTPPSRRPRPGPRVTAPEVRPAMKASISSPGERAPVALGANDFLRQHQAPVCVCARDEGAQQLAESLRAALARIPVVSSWLGSPPERPAAKLVTSETATQSRPCKPREDDLRHRRHADEIGAENLGRADFGRRLERGAVEPHVDAFVQRRLRRLRRAPVEASPAARDHRRGSSARSGRRTG